MNEKQELVSSFVIQQLDGKEKVESEDIMYLINVFAQINPITEEQKQEVLRDVQSKIQISIDKGVLITEKSHLPWYNSAKGNIEPKFWNRYKLYLRQQGWNNAVLNEMDDATDAIMDLLGNPGQEEGFNRRGLCIGEVQSGKTSNYIALINKAADAGYKVIILLTGVMENHPGLGEDGKYHVKADEHPLPEGTCLTYALVGNQNCGKTTLFNQLTGSNRRAV